MPSDLFLNLFFSSRVRSALHLTMRSTKRLKSIPVSCNNSVSLFEKNANKVRNENLQQHWIKLEGKDNQKNVQYLTGVQKTGRVVRPLGE